MTNKVRDNLIFLELNLNILGFGGHGSVSGSFSSKAYENSTNGVIAASSLGYSGGLSSSKGLSFKEVLATLVLITRGTHEEKIKCEFNYDKFIPSRFVHFRPKMN